MMSVGSARMRAAATVHAASLLELERDSHVDRWTTRATVPLTLGSEGAKPQLAEADGNRTRQAGDAHLNGFEGQRPASTDISTRPVTSALSCGNDLR
jgi:hypothetical protein